MGQDPTTKRKIKTLLYILVFLHSSVVIYAFFIQQVRGDELRLRGKRQGAHRIPLQGRRGSILDRNGKKLAMDLKMNSVCAMPSEVKNPARAASLLNRSIGVSSTRLRSKFASSRDFVWLKRLIDDETAEKVSNLDLEGIELIPEMGRFYPYGTSAAAVIGIKGMDEGIEGAEFALEDWLRGEQGYVILKKDATSRTVPFSVRERVDPHVGSDVYLTLDMRIQFYAESELERAIQEFNAKAGSVIVMDPSNGQILAMAGYPTFDPNEFWKYDQIRYRNRPIWKVFEPGSIMKPVVISMAVDAGVIDPFKDYFHCKPLIKLSGHTIREHDPEGLPAYKSVTEIITHSYNTGAAKIAMKLDEQRLRNYLGKFNFGHRYDTLRLNGQEKGLMPREKRWRDVTIATIGFGQGIGVTALQVANSFCAIANGGILFEPAIVEKVVSPEGKTIHEFKPDPIRRVISAKTSRVMKYMLHQTVEDGTGKNAKVPGYTVAGKTGTAEVPGKNGYEPGKYISSFAGFAPVDDPKLFVLVVVELPWPRYYAGDVAAPAFREIMRKSLWYLDVPPSESEPGSVSY